jgi:hypothetical protein
MGGSFDFAKLYPSRHAIASASEAIQKPGKKAWIASSLALLAMTAVSTQEQNNL